MFCPNCGKDTLRFDTMIDVRLKLDKNGKILGLADPDMSAEELIENVDDTESEVICSNCGYCCPARLDENNRVEIIEPTFGLE